MCSIIRPSDLPYARSSVRSPVRPIVRPITPAGLYIRGCLLRLLCCLLALWPCPTVTVQGDIARLGNQSPCCSARWHGRLYLCEGPDGCCPTIQDLQRVFRRGLPDDRAYIGQFSHVRHNHQGLDNRKVGWTVGRTAGPTKIIPRADNS